MAEPVVNLPDVPALPGPALSWAPGEPLPGVKDVTDKMAGVQREKVAAETGVMGQFDAASKKLMPRIEELSKDAGVEAQQLKPWDADAQSAKYHTDPVMAFGSFGSVFGMLASAFTHAPMENALNASAAAMNAIKENDKTGYERAHKAWEENYKMAMDRHKIKHDAYQDAVALLQTNMTMANAKLQMLAARFGDKQVQVLLEAGMNKEVEELLQARQRNAINMSENFPKIVAANAEISRLFALGYDFKNPTSEQSQDALVKFQKEKAELKRMEHTTSANPAAVALQTFMAQHPDATAEQMAEFLRSTKNAGATNLTPDRQRAQDILAYREQLKAEKNADGSPKWTAAEIAEKAAQFDKHLKTTAAAPTGNKIDELTGKINRVEYAESTIDKVEELLKKHKAITGLGGMVTRPAEVVSNIFGGNETDRKQFERYISELQEWAPRILTDSNGRPLSSEAGKVMTIIAGLRPGDTTANTARAYAELRPLLKRIKDDLAKRRGDITKESPALAQTKRPTWQDAPLVGR